MSANTGGNAFPSEDTTFWPESGAVSGSKHHAGLSIRDWFASNASEDDVNAFVPSSIGECCKAMGVEIKDWTPELAQLTRVRAKYAYADMMLREREKGSQ